MSLSNDIEDNVLIFYVTPILAKSLANDYFDAKLGIKALIYRVVFS